MAHRIIPARVRPGEVSGVIERPVDMTLNASHPGGDRTTLHAVTPESKGMLLRQNLFSACCEEATDDGFLSTTG